MLNNNLEEKQKLYVRFDNLDDIKKTLETFYMMYEHLVTYYSNKSYFWLETFLGTIVLYVVSVYKGLGFMSDENIEKQ
jgi:hypothetical protein